MSSSAKGPYRSRLFNFLNRQSLRLTTQANLALRNVKVTAVWGVQILIYPLYLLTQASLSVARQLSSKTKARLNSFTQSQAQPEAMLPAADAPIQRVLEAVNSLPEEMGEVQRRGDAETRRHGDKRDKEDNETISHSPFPIPHSPFPIQGIATLLSNRRLVLVATHNQILEVLTLEQQQKLSAKISWEVAGLLRQRRLELSSDNQLAPRPLIRLAQPRMLLPVRLFWRLMAWIQTGPVAIAANLFGESKLACNVTIVPEQTQFPQGQPQPSSQLPEGDEQLIISRLVSPEALAFLDGKVAELESNQLVSATEAVIVLRERTYQLFQRRQTQLRTPGDSSAAPEQPQTLKARIRELIYAAVEYFFGKDDSNLSQAETPQQLSTPVNPLEQTNQLPGNDANFLPPAGQALEKPQTLKARIRELIYAAVEYFFGKDDSNLSHARTPQQLSTSIYPPGQTNQLPGNDANFLPPFGQALEEDETLKTRIQALIYAAVEYFFGKSGSHLPWTRTLEQLSGSVNPPGDATTSLPPVAQSPNLALSDTIEPDPWLTLEDLFGKQDLPPTNPTPISAEDSTTSTAQLPEAFGIKMPVQPETFLVDSVKSRQKSEDTEQKIFPANDGDFTPPLPIPPIEAQKVNPTLNQEESLSLIQPKQFIADTDIPAQLIEGKLNDSAALQTEIPDATHSLLSTESKVQEDNQQLTIGDNLEPAQEWIDTDASTTGYVKHPLEKVLEWLDSAMLKIEQFAIKIWRWLRR